MSDYSKIRQTSEYREAKREVQEMIDRDIGLLRRHVDEIGTAVRTAEEKLKMLEEHSKAFTMIFAAVFGALSDNPDLIRRIIDNLRISMNAAVQQNAHAAIRAELSKALTLLEALPSVRH